MKVFDKAVYVFSKDNEPIATAAPGEVLLFKTMDCFGEQFTSEDQLVDELDLSKSNPATGPIYIEGAEPGDVLAVDILDIVVKECGFACSMGECGPLADISELRTRMIPIKDGCAYFNDILWPIKPMIGVIGLAPDGDDVPSGMVGNHGGNIDSNYICKGARVYLPVRVPGGLLQMGDLHATMGDGEICGTGIEVSGEILVRTSLIKNFKIEWPVTEYNGWWYVNPTGKDYEDALIIGCREMSRLMEPVYGWDTTDNFIYLSLQGSIEVNQGVKPVHEEMFNLRIGIPKTPGKKPLVG